MAELHPNALNAMRGFQAFAAGDMATMKELFHDDAVWHVGGRNRWSGDYEGLDAILGFFGDIAGEASISQDVHAILGDDDHVVALINSTAKNDKSTSSLQALLSLASPLCLNFLERYIPILLLRFDP